LNLFFPAGNLSLGFLSLKSAYHPLLGPKEFQGLNYVKAKKLRFSLDPIHKKNVAGGKLTSRYKKKNIKYIYPPQYRLPVLLSI
jgi:hypothetical protein